MIEPIFYVSLDVEKGLGIEDLLPAYNILYKGRSHLHDMILSNGVNVLGFDLPDDPNITTYDLLKNTKVLEYIREFSGDLPSNILVFKSDSFLEAFVREQGFNLLNPFSELVKKLENKINVVKFFEGLGLSQPGYIICDSFDDTSYIDLSNRLGKSFVIQFTIGHSGNSTFFVDSKEDFDLLKVKYARRKFKASALISGPTYTVNACATRLGTIVSGISEQITGVPELTPSRGGTVGNEMSQRHLNDELRLELINQTIALGDQIYKMGFRGMFGVDAVLDIETKKFFFIEVNPRQIASSSFVSYVQRINGIVPIFLWHVLELLGHDYSSDFFLLNETDHEWINNEIKKFINSTDRIDSLLLSNRPIRASQVFFRNLKDHRVKIVDDFPSGAYRIRGRVPEESSAIERGVGYLSVYPVGEGGWSTLCLEKKSYNLVQIPSNENFLILTKSKGTTIDTLEEIGRIQVLDSLFNDMDTFTPNGWVMDVIDSIYENMTLEKVVENKTT